MKLPREAVKYLLIHQSATPRADTTFEGIKRYHLSLGWGNIAYHYFIESDGKIRKGRNERTAGTHTKAGGMNLKSLGICLKPGSKIFTADGSVIDIAKIQPGIRVLSASGAPTKITQSFTRKFAGRLITIKPFYLPPLSLTPEHPVLIIRGSRCKWDKKTHSKPNCPYTRRKYPCDCIKKWRGSKPIWMPARRVQPDDWVVFPKLRTTKSLTPIDLSRYIKARQFYHVSRHYITERRKSVKTNRYLRWNDERFLKLLGWYLAEGFGGGNKKSVDFAIHRRDIGPLTDIVQSILQYKVGVYANKRGNQQGALLRFHSVIWRNLLKDLVGSGAKNKRIPPQIFWLPENKIRVFLDAYMDGDGSRRNRDEHISTSSEQIAWQLILLGIKIGMPFSFTVRRPRGFLNYVLYRFPRHKNHPLYVADERNYYFIVRGVNRERYSGKVHNIETENNTYLSSFTVHNCLAGNFNNEEPTEAQLKSLEAILRSLAAKYKIPKERILGHLEVCGAVTQCPGENLLEWIENYRKKSK